jgi:hypothetical protein
VTSRYRPVPSPEPNQTLLVFGWRKRKSMRCANCGAEDWHIVDDYDVCSCCGRESEEPNGDTICIHCGAINPSRVSALRSFFDYAVGDFTVSELAEMPRRRKVYDCVLSPDGMGPMWSEIKEIEHR